MKNLIWRIYAKPAKKESIIDDFIRQKFVTFYIILSLTNKIFLFDKNDSINNKNKLQPHLLNWIKYK